MYVHLLSSLLWNVASEYQFIFHLKIASELASSAPVFWPLLFHVFHVLPSLLKCWALAQPYLIGPLVIPALTMAPSFAGDGFQQVVSLFCQNLHPLTFSFLFTWLEISNNMGTASILATLNCNYEGTSLSHDVKSVAFWLLLQRWKSWSFFSPVVPLAFFYISSGNWKQSYCCVIVLGMNRMNSILLVLECS